MADLELDTTGASASSGAPASSDVSEPGHRPLKGRGSDNGERRAFWAELPFLVVIALVLAIVLKTFVVQAFYIPSSSMEPTLMVQDRVLVTKLAYLYREPMRGEIVVFQKQGDDVLGQEEGLVSRVVGSLASGLGFGQGDEVDFIKRIIGLPGETVEMRGGVVYIDGEALPEATATEGGYLSRPDLSDFGPVTVEEGHYFMMGDNRPNSSDSRFSLGQIAREDIIGRAFVTIWPIENFGSLPIADYGE